MINTGLVYIIIKNKYNKNKDSSNTFNLASAIHNTYIHTYLREAEETKINPLSEIIAI